MVTAPSGPAPAFGRAARWRSRLLSAAEWKSGSSTLIDFTFSGSFRASHGPGIVWADEGSKATGFMRLFVFSYATLSGANYAEIAPATGFALNTASLEAMIGQILLAVVVARLVGFHVTPPRDTAGLSKP